MGQENDLNKRLTEFSKERPLIIGRRGLAEKFPENTLAGYEAAIEAKCDAIELDVRVTLDGHLVCSHDEDLWRCVNFAANPEAKGLRVSDMTLTEVRRIDVGGWKGSRFVGLSMPTLEEALDVIAPHAIPVIERKSGTSDQLADVLERKKAIDKVVVCDFDWDLLAALRARSSNLVLGANGTGPFDARNLTRLSGKGISIINWEYYGLTKEDAKAVCDAGFHLWTWTINHEFEFEDSRAMQASGIISDRPDQLRKWM